MFDDVVEYINLLVVPMYSSISRCKSIEYSSNGFPDTCDGRVLLFNFVKCNYGAINNNELREMLKTLFMMLDYINKEYYGCFFWLRFDYDEISRLW